MNVDREEDKNTFQISLSLVIFSSENNWKKNKPGCSTLPLPSLLIGFAGTIVHREKSSAKNIFQNTYVGLFAPKLIDTLYLQKKNITFENFGQWRW